MIMKGKTRITRLIITALIVSLAAILTALSPINPEKTPAQAGTEFDPIDAYVRGPRHRQGGRGRPPPDVRRR
jgi:hypothetical protein